ncbi:(5-formylfuran-3-yl)methyl phosphate transaminase (4-HFC-P:alanine aminotransferase) [Durusdinium trenchii]|uniref:(5-formylfuran-3-yl)methyl phosphate transaminase (4-HFC-P:alanine aminotransferase) n=1 Tax=Durusdinium trenchii TaxID=1381693 RepID=A0ABP0M6T7_9DINO
MAGSYKTQAKGPHSRRLRTAERLSDIAPFRVMQLMERAKALEAEGHRVVHFEVGEPDFPTAEPIVAAGQVALEAGHTKYTQALGTPELRARIAAYYRESAGLSIKPERVVVTTGASGGLLLLAALLLNPEDELLLPDPGYPCNEVFLGVVNARPRRLPVDAEAGFQVTAERLASEWTPQTRGLLLGSPANPTGVLTPRRDLEALIRAVHEREGLFLLDEIYQGLIYGEGGSQPEYRTGLAISDEVFVLNSFSKYFGMTGWRLGWMVVPEQCIDPVSRLAQNLFISPSSIAQQAALAAFDAPAMAIHETRRAQFAARRDQLAAGLRTLGLGIPVDPVGAFYLYVDVSSTGLDSEQFCWRLIDEFQVAVTPGIDFGEHLADRYVRFAYTTGEEAIDLGLERIGQALDSWR